MSHHEGANEDAKLRFATRSDWRLEVEDICDTAFQNPYGVQGSSRNRTINFKILTSEVVYPDKRVPMLASAPYHVARDLK